MGKVRSVLFVCTGNSCRSVMAEGLLKKALKELGKGYINVSSAGTCAVDGFHPTRETIEVMKREDIDVSGFKSRLLTDEIMMGADIILVMAANHMDDVITRLPEVASKTFMLKQYGKPNHSHACEDLDIADPIGKPVEVYEHILADIKKEVYRIAKIL